MTIALPKKAVDALRFGQRQLDSDGGQVGVSRQALEELLDFARAFETRALPEMIVAGQLNELLIADPSVDAQVFDVVRVNNRAFVPEALVLAAAEGADPAVPPCDHTPELQRITLATKEIAGEVGGSGFLTVSGDCENCGKVPFLINLFPGGYSVSEEAK